MNKTEINKSSYKIGVISDTHGLLRPEVLTAFQGVDMIMHAGDIGGPEILSALEEIAPVLAVRGNMDYGVWLEEIPATREVKLGKFQFFLVHDPGHIDFDPQEGVFQAVVNGHTHQPHLEDRKGVLLLNPGSAGYRRRHYPVSIAMVNVDGNHITAELIEIK